MFGGINCIAVDDDDDYNSEGITINPKVKRQ